MDIHLTEGQKVTAGLHPDKTMTEQCEKLRDQRVVLAKVKLSLRSRNKTQPARVKYDWNQLRNDQEMQRRCTVAIKNRYYALSEKGETEQTSTEKYQRLTDASRSATEEIIQALGKAKTSTVSNNSGITKIRREVNTEYNTY